MYHYYHTSVKDPICRALVLVSMSAVAQVSAEQLAEAELPPVTVAAHDFQALPYDQSGVSVSILDVGQLKEQGVTQLSDALLTAPGVYVLPGGGDNQRGNVSSISVRGMSKGAYMLPMVDGMRLSVPSAGGNPTSNVLARTQLFDTGTVELLRGAEGAVYGGGAVGAVLFMETPEGKGEPGGSVFQEFGSFDSYTGNVTAQGATDKLSYFLSATGEHTNNDIKYADGSRPQSRHAGRYVNKSEAARFDWRANDTNKLTLTYRREDAEYHTADYGPYHFRTNLSTLAWNSRLSEVWSSQLMAGYYGYDADMGGYHSNIRNVQVEWRHSFRWNERHNTAAGLCWVRSDFRSKNEGQGTDAMSSSLDNTYSLFAEHVYTPSKAWTSCLAARLDSSSVYDEHGTLRAAGSYRFNRQRTRMFTSVGTGYVAPGHFQRSTGSYVSWGTEYTGNPDLDVETATTADFGVEQRIAETHYVSATLFWGRTQDAIVTAPLPDGRVSFINDSGHQTMQGVELELRGSFEARRNTGYRLAYTYTQPKANDRQIANTARQTWSADVHTSPLRPLTLGFGVAACAQRCDWAGKRLDDYYALRCYANYELNEHVRLHLRVENITNQRFITESGGGYGPDMLNAGTAVYGGCTLSF